MRHEVQKQPDPQNRARIARLSTNARVLCDKCTSTSLFQPDAGRVGIDQFLSAPPLEGLDQVPERRAVLLI